MDLGVASPVALGDTASVSVTVGVGPTCTIKVTYPSGAMTNGGSPRQPNPGQWMWTWTVPTSAGAGTATVKINCTYTGIPMSATSTMTILAAATPAPGWTMDVRAPSIWYWNDPNPMPFEVDIAGLLPGSSAGGEVYLQCRFNIGFQTKSFILDVLQPFANGSGGFVYYADFGGPLGETEIGSARGYYVECFNYHGEPLTVQSDGGQFDVPAAPSIAPG